MTRGAWRMTISNDGTQHERTKESLAMSVATKKALYIAQAHARLPKYYSPDKQVKLQQMTTEEIYAEGLPKEILWKMVEYNLSAKNGMSTQRLCKIVEHIDYLASQYVTYHERIHRDFSDEALHQQIAQLQETFNRSFERMAYVYVEAVGDFFARNELKEERTLLYSSIQELYHRKVTHYSDYVRLHEDFAQLAGTKDAWLLRDSYFMGDILRLLAKEETLLPPTFYSEAELIAAGAFYQSARKWLIMQKSTAVSEEQLGIELGIFAMKTLVLTSHPSVTEPLRHKFQIAYESFFAYKVNDLDKRQREEFRNPYATDKRLYGPIDRDAVQRWTNKMYAYALAGRIEEVFTDVVHEAFEVFDEKVRASSHLERYQDSNEWYRFAQQQDLVSQQMDAFTLQLRISDWNAFLTSIQAEEKWFFTLKY